MGSELGHSIPRVSEPYTAHSSRTTRQIPILQIVHRFMRLSCRVTRQRSLHILEKWKPEPDIDNAFMQPL